MSVWQVFCGQCHFEYFTLLTRENPSVHSRDKDGKRLLSHHSPTQPLTPHILSFLVFTFIPSELPQTISQITISVWLMTTGLLFFTLVLTFYVLQREDGDVNTSRRSRFFDSFETKPSELIVVWCSLRKTVTFNHLINLLCEVEKLSLSLTSIVTVHLGLLPLQPQGVFKAGPWPSNAAAQLHSALLSSCDFLLFVSCPNSFAALLPATYFWQAVIRVITAGRL